jgi:DNA-binding SARP family transcriptional activator
MDWQGRMCRDDLAALCATALEAGIEPDYVRALIRCRRLLPVAKAVDVEAWPWPVKIFCLGRFSLVCDGKPVTFTGKAQRRPLELLRVLIALGGRDVAQARVAAILGPEADGDAAAAAFDTTLNRLRKLLGRADAVTLSADKLAVNPRVCWVDAWAFERRLKAAANDIDKAESALDLYRGPFLGADEEDWSISFREKLQAHFLRGVRGVGARLEAATRWEHAAALYERGLAADDLAEELYQQLMVCHLELGQRGAALAAYGRCENVLRSRLRIAPSAKTQEIRRRFIS